MKWKLNPKTGCMEQVVSPAKEIEKALAPIGDIPEWSGIHHVKKNAIILYNRDAYLAIAFNGQWRLLGIITNMHTIEKYLRRPLVDFHNAWLRGTPINKPELN